MSLARWSAAASDSRRRRLPKPASRSSFLSSNTRSPTAAINRDGVFKVLKPGIEERLELELELLGRVGVHLDERCVELQFRTWITKSLFEQIRDKLRHEVRLDEEQQHLVQAGALLMPTSRKFIFLHCSNIARRESQRWSGSPAAKSRTTACRPT